MRPSVISAAIFLLLARSTAAAPPELRSQYPAAGQRGVETRLQLLGTEFVTGMKLLVPFAAEVRLDSAGSGQAFFFVKPDKDVVPGVYPIRVRTEDGVSNILLFAVTDVPVIREVEPNGRLEQAQRIDWPCMIAGSMGGVGAPHPSKDTDLYRFSVKAGQRLTIVGETRRLGLSCDLLIRLRNASGRELAYADDTPGIGVDPRLDYTFTDAGEYILEVHLSAFNYGGRNLTYLVKVGDLDYARNVFPLGGRRGEKLRVSVTGRDGKATALDTNVPTDPWAEEWLVPLASHSGSLACRLAIGDGPEITEGAERTSPQTVEWPITINGRIAKPNEVDRYRIAVTPGQKVRASVQAFRFLSALDGVLRAFDPDGKLIAEGAPRRPRMEIDPLLDFTVPDNVRVVTITLEDGFARGGADFTYRLTLEPGGPDFELLLGADYPRDNYPQNDVLHLPVGQPVTLPVKILRRGYDGPIKISALDPPAGVSVQLGVIPEGKNVGSITVTASKQAAASLFELALVGDAESEGRLLRRKALRPLHLAEPYPTNLPWNWRLTRVVCCKLPGGDK